MIAAGGLVGLIFQTVMTRSVEVLHIADTDSHCSVVEQLPHVCLEQFH